MQQDEYSNDELETISTADLPEWTNESLPEDAKIVMLTNEENFDFGGTIQTAYLLDLSRIAATSIRAGNTTTLYSEGADITVPEGTVVPAYVESFDSHSTLRAQANSETTKAQFLILARSQNVDDSYIIQSTGYYTFNEPHNYEVGQIYYLSDSSAGGVTTTAPTSGIVQPLFSVLTDTVIQINVGA